MKAANSPHFANWRVMLKTWKIPYPTTPVKLNGFAPISGTTSGNRGVDMSTPVHLVAMPPFQNRGKLISTEGCTKQHVGGPVLRRLTNAVHLTKNLQTNFETRTGAGDWEPFFSTGIKVKNQVLSW